MPHDRRVAPRTPVSGLVLRRREEGRGRTVWSLINSHPPGQGEVPSLLRRKVDEAHLERKGDLLLGGGGGWVAVVDAPGNNPEGGRNFIIPGLIIQRASL